MVLFCSLGMNPEAFLPRKFVCVNLKFDFCKYSLTTNATQTSQQFFCISTPYYLSFSLFPPSVFPSVAPLYISFPCPLTFLSLTPHHVFFLLSCNVTSLLFHCGSMVVEDLQISTGMSYLNWLAILLQHFGMGYFGEKSC